jgi:uncharacterized SAM-binding protein YcdF (DUF218 family)
MKDTAAHSDAAMVFGGDPGYERTRYASQLLHEKWTRTLVLCGGEPGPGDSATSLREAALEQGVPAEAILMEQHSRSTREAALRVGAIVRQHGIGSLILVTSPYHQRRAYLVTRRVLNDEIRLINQPADPSFWSPRGWWKHWKSTRIVVTEYSKLAYYFVRGWI